MKQGFDVRERAAAWTVGVYLSSVAFVLVSWLRGWAGKSLPARRLAEPAAIAYFLAAHVLTTINELRDHGVTVKSLTENFELDTREGRFMFAVLAAAAEYELELRAERQAEGIAAARRRQAEGRMLPGKKHIGRPKVTGPAEITTLRRLVDDGTSVTQAARTLKISRSTAYAALASTR